MRKTSELKGQTAEEFIEERHALEATMVLVQSLHAVGVLGNNGQDEST
jgi:hypothetical protein